MREFGAGVSMLLRGFGWWRRHPRAMALGLIPAVLVAVALIALLITLAGFLPALTAALTPFAEGWAEVWTTLLRVGVGAAVFGGALVLSVVSFTALTLLVGEPFYDRVWRSVEQEAGGVPEVSYGFWRAIGDTASLILRGFAVALLAALVGLIPVAGSIAGAVLGVTLTGWLLADELTSRALTARGVDRAARRRLLRAHRARTLGFGVATQLCFLVPLGAVAVMPAAVAGSTLWVQALEPELPAHG